MAYRKLSGSSKGTVEDLDVTTTGATFTRRHKMAFGFPAMANSQVEVLTQAYVSHYYTTQFSVGTAYLSLAVVLCGLLRTLTQLSVGYLSDHTSSKKGRRTPWILVFTPILAVSIFAVLFPPFGDGMSSEGAAAYFTVTYACFNASYGVLQVTYNSVGAELCATNEARRSLFSWQAVFNVTGLLTVAALTGAMSETAGMHVLGSAVAVIVFVSYMMLARLAQDATPEYAEVKMGLIPGLRATLQHREYRYMLGSVIAGSLLNEVTSLFLYLFSAQWGMSDDEAESTLSVLLGVYVVGNMAAIPLGRHLMKSRGKVAAYRMGFWFMMGYGATGYLATFAGSAYVLAGPLVLLGLGTGITQIVQPVLLNDVISLDELRTGDARASTFHSVADTPQELFSVMGRAIPLMALSGLGFRTGDGVAQPPGVVTFLCMFCTLLAIASGGLSLLALRKYELTEDKVMDVLNGIERLSKGLSAVDPLTGETIEPLNVDAGSQRLSTTLTSLEDPRARAEQSLWYFSYRELATMVNQGKNEVMGLWGASVALWGAYMVALCLKGVQLLLDREVDLAELFAALWCGVLLVFIFQLVRWHGIQWFMATPAEDFALYVEDHQRRAPAWARDNFSARASPVLRFVATHAVVGGGVVALCVLVNA